MTKLPNPETQSFQFHTLWDNFPYHWNHRTKSVNWNDGKVSRSTTYETRIVSSNIASLSWIVGSLEDTLKSAVVPDLVRFGVFNLIEEHLDDYQKYSGTVYYTDEWDYSTDYGSEHIVNVSRIVLSVRDKEIEIPLDLLSGDELEYVKDFITELGDLEE